MTEDKPNFSVTEQKYDRHLVIPDIHGENEILKKVVDNYFDEADICFVFLGDLIDKRNSSELDYGARNTLEIVRSLGERAIITIANHEWSCLAALYDKDTDRRKEHEWADVNFYGTKSTIRSYSIDPEHNSSFSELKNVMESLGHSALLLSSTPYYETEKFIATHAGVVHNWDWDEQKSYLELVAAEMANGKYEPQPQQWFSTELACDTRSIMSTDKIVVSGHAHYLEGSRQNFRLFKTNSERSLNDGKRIRLASQLNGTCQPLYVWQDWDEQIVLIVR